MSTHEHLQETLKRIQVGSTIGFNSIRIQCGSWRSAYEYVYNETPETPADVTQFSADVKGMDNVSYEENGTGRLTIVIGIEILKGKGTDNGKMEQAGKGSCAGIVKPPGAGSGRSDSDKARPTGFKQRAK